MSLLTSRDSHSLDTYQSRDPRIKIAAQRIAPLEYMLKVIENIPPKSFVGLDWIRNRCGRSLERMGMIRLTSKGRGHPPSRRNTECFTRTEHGTVRIPFRPRLSLVVLTPVSPLFVRLPDTESDEMSTRNLRTANTVSFRTCCGPFIRKPASLTTPRQEVVYLDLADNSPA